MLSLEDFKNQNYETLKNSFKLGTEEQYEISFDQIKAHNCYYTTENEGTILWVYEITEPGKNDKNERFYRTLAWVKSNESLKDSRWKFFEKGTIKYYALPEKRKEKMTEEKKDVTVPNDGKSTFDHVVQAVSDGAQMAVLNKAADGLLELARAALGENIYPELMKTEEGQQFVKAFAAILAIEASNRYPEYVPSPEAVRKGAGLVLQKNTADFLEPRIAKFLEKLPELGAKMGSLFAADKKETIKTLISAAPKVRVENHDATEEIEVDTSEMEEHKTKNGAKTTSA